MSKVRASKPVERRRSRSAELALIADCRAAFTVAELRYSELKGHLEKVDEHEKVINGHTTAITELTRVVGEDETKGLQGRTTAIGDKVCGNSSKGIVGLEQKDQDNRNWIKVIRIVGGGGLVTVFTILFFILANHTELLQKILNSASGVK